MEEVPAMAAAATKQQDVIIPVLVSTQDAQGVALHFPVPDMPPVWLARDHPMHLTLPARAAFSAHVDVLQDADEEAGMPAVDYNGSAILIPVRAAAGEAAGQAALLLFLSISTPAGPILRLVSGAPRLQRLFINGIPVPREALGQLASVHQVPTGKDPAPRPFPVDREQRAATEAVVESAPAAVAASFVFSVTGEARAAPRFQPMDPRWRVASLAVPRASEAMRQGPLFDFVRLAWHPALAMVSPHASASGGSEDALGASAQEGQEQPGQDTPAASGLPSWLLGLLVAGGSMLVLLALITSWRKWVTPRLEASATAALPPLPVAPATASPARTLGMSS